MNDYFKDQEVMESTEQGEISRICSTPKRPRNCPPSMSMDLSPLLMASPALQRRVCHQQTIVPVRLFHGIGK